MATAPRPRLAHPDLPQPTPSGSGSAPTDFNSLNDAVGISGVDIAAEEEIARQQRIGRSQQQQTAWAVTRERDKVLDFLERGPLTTMVQQIAASYQLKTLEPAILDVLSQAAEHRLHSIILDSIAAKQHRLSSSHLRPPPLYPNPKGKEKAQEEAMYNQTIYDQPERILSILARVEGEEERRVRNERVVDSDEEVQTVESSITEALDKKMDGNKKRKREGPGQQARNMSEDARARQSNQTAMRSVGGRGSKYSWLSGGGPPSIALNLPSPIKKIPIIAALPAPKFAPSSKKMVEDSSRLGGLIPAPHAASSASVHSDRVGVRDCLFALERERGQGVGKGSGSKVLCKTYVRRNGLDR